VNSEHFKERGYFVEVDHPITGPKLYPGAPMKLSETPYQISRAPVLGEHNEEIYCQRLGYTKDDLVRMKGEGVV
jgi:crotonobetainyl-CoA:carnitine CoA-transferase CaiB-like acyl-CoA transferase